MITKLFSSFFFICFSVSVFGQFTWEKMNTVYPTGISNFSLQFSIVNDQVIWAGYWNDSGKVAFTKSTNAGNTWSAVPNVLQYNDYHFLVEDFQALSENIAFLGSTYQANIGKGRLYKTLDGGITWNLMKEFATGLTYVHFWNDHTGIVVCYPDMSNNGAKKIEIFRTTDGGSNWVAKGGALLTNSKPNQIPRYIHDDLNDSFWFGSSDGEMIKTNDKGVTWVVTQTPYDSSHYELGAKSLGDFAIIDNNTAYYTDYNTGKFYKTTDGFLTEQYVSDLGFGKQTKLDKIPNTNILIAVGGNLQPGFISTGSKYSTDEGQTWTTISTTGRYKVKSFGLNMTFSHGWDGTGGVDDYKKIVKLNGGLPPNTGPGTGPVIGPGVVIPPSGIPLDDVLFDIYPIPTGDFLYFKSKYDNLDFTMWDSAGRLIMKGTTVSKKIDVSAYPEGVYHINVIYEGQEIIRKFIKK